MSAVGSRLDDVGRMYVQISCMHLVPVLAAAAPLLPFAVLAKGTPAPGASD